MKYRTLLKTGLTALIVISSPAWSYDAGLAQSYAELFAPVAGAKAGKALHLMPPEVFVKGLQTKRPIVTIDVRTPNEFGLVGMTLPNNMSIPVNKVFVKENLDRIPKDRPVVIICKTGARATAVGTALRHVGFKNVYVLNGGITALIKYISPKTANPSPNKRVVR